jgi:hypothetical protein
MSEYGDELVDVLKRQHAQAIIFGALAMLAWKIGCLQTLIVFFVAAHLAFAGFVAVIRYLD